MNARALTRMTVLSAAVAWPLLAAGSSPLPEKPKVAPTEEAIKAYNEGLKHRDKAWKLEAELKSASDAKSRQKLEAKMLKEFEKAVKSFERAVDFDASLHQAWSGLGYARRRSGDFEGSLAAYDRALELAPGYAEAIEYRAEAYLALDRLDETKQAYLALQNGSSERANDLLLAMRDWVDRHRQTPDELSSDTVEAFAQWVEERAQLAGLTGASTDGGDW